MSSCLLHTFVEFCSLLKISQGWKFKFLQLGLCWFLHISLVITSWKVTMCMLCYLHDQVSNSEENAVFVFSRVDLKRLHLLSSPQGKPQCETITYKAALRALVGLLVYLRLYLTWISRIQRLWDNLLNRTELWQSGTVCNRFGWWFQELIKK